MKKNAFLNLLILFAILFGNAFCGRNSVPPGRKNKEILPGFYLVKSPASDDRPGTVFRVDKREKASYRVKTLDIQPSDANISIPSKENQKELNIGTLLDFIALKSSNIDLTSSNSFKNKKTYTFNLNNTKIYRLDDTQVSEHWEKLKEIVIKNEEIMDIKKNRYFIIREAVSATEIQIGKVKENVGSDSLIAKIDKIVDANIGVSWASIKKTELNISAKTPLFVFYKPQEIIFVKQAAGGLSYKLVDLSTESERMFYESHEGN